MKVLHISMECYPAAKSGGLGDVAGALPIYLNKAAVETAVIIPKFQTKWLLQQNYREIFRGSVRLHLESIPFAIEEVVDSNLGFPLFVVNIPGKFDRPGIYGDASGWGYSDEVERHLCFQQAVLHWLLSWDKKPDVLHCHDHHTGLIPFMVKHCPEYQSLSHIPTVFTIHNGAYHGAYSWNKMHLLPWFDGHAKSLLDWGNTINPLATGIKCCWKLTTVSPGYLQELREKSNGLEWLINNELPKATGIINGIDTSVWDPSSDKYLTHHLQDDITIFKNRSKEVLLHRFRIAPHLPIITFIGRLVGEKGADLLPQLIHRVLGAGIQAGFIILGTGDPNLHRSFEGMRHQLQGYFDASLEYNEGLAHQLYAGSDFLIMPSRVEPCGLNQMYACRYGTVPIVRSIGGLRNTIPDVGEPDGSGRGIRFDNFSVEDAGTAVYRATEVYKDQENFTKLRQKIMAADFSWERSATDYINIYTELTDR